jgi:hypothetical protein
VFANTFRQDIRKSPSGCHTAQSSDEHSHQGSAPSSSGQGKTIVILCQRIVGQGYTHWIALISLSLFLSLSLCPLPPNMVPNSCLHCLIQASSAPSSAIRDTTTEHSTPLSQVLRLREDISIWMTLIKTVPCHHVCVDYFPQSWDFFFTYLSRNFGSRKWMTRSVHLKLRWLAWRD